MEKIDLKANEDVNWVNSSFMLSSKDIAISENHIRFFSTGSLKFVDTTPGGHYCINPPPQFTRTADIKAKSVTTPDNDYPKLELNSYEINNGYSSLGRYYSEAIDDNAQLVSMRFGVPKFNNFITFFQSMYGNDASLAARTGRISSIFNTVGKAIGVIFALYCPPLMLTHLVTGIVSAVRFAIGKPLSKYYYLKPTMPLYWTAVQTIVNHIGANKGINNVSKTQSDTMLQIEDVNNYFKEYAEMIPDVFDNEGMINVYGLATRGQRKYRKFREYVEKNLDPRMTNSGMNAVQEFFTRPLSDASKAGDITLSSYLSKWLGNEDGKEEGGGNDDKSSVDRLELFKAYPKQQKDGVIDMLNAELDDGSAFVTFRVNYTGSVSESFSNSVTESGIQSTINSASAQSRNMRFNLSDGNVDQFGIIKTVTDAAVGLVNGALSTLGLEGIAKALMGNCFVDVPKHWDSSSVSLPRSNYTVSLVSPYGNPLSRLLHIDIPLAMLLAAALPLSTGKQTYTSPFICELYDRGRCQTRMGMIDTLTVTRGTGNLGWNNQHQLLALEVNFSVVDLSNVMHMPIKEGFTLDIKDSLFDEDTIFSDYMAILAGLGIADQIYASRKLRLKFSYAMNNLKTTVSWPNFAMWLGRSTPISILSMFYKGVPR